MTLGSRVGAAFAAGVLAWSTPAAALSGADLLRDVCLATFPHFDGADERIATYHGRQVADYEGRLFELIDATKRRTWSVSDASMASDPFLVDVAWGNLASRQAAACMVMDKRGFRLAELKGELTVKEFRVRPGKMLYETVADAIVARRDGRRLWLTLVLADGQKEPDANFTIWVAVLMSSEYLDALIEKAP